MERRKQVRPIALEPTCHHAGDTRRMAEDHEV